MTREQIINLLNTGVIRQNALAKVIFPDKKRPDCWFSDKLLNRRGRYLTKSDIDKINEFFNNYLN